MWLWYTQRTGITRVWAIKRKCVVSTHQGQGCNQRPSPAGSSSASPPPSPTKTTRLNLRFYFLCLKKGFITHVCVTGEILFRLDCFWVLWTRNPAFRPFCDLAQPHAPRAGESTSRISGLVGSTVTAVIQPSLLGTLSMGSATSDGSVLQQRDIWIVPRSLCSSGYARHTLCSACATVSLKHLGEGLLVGNVSFQPNKILPRVCQSGCTCTLQYTVDPWTWVWTAWADVHADFLH